MNIFTTLYTSWQTAFQGGEDGIIITILCLNNVWLPPSKCCRKGDPFQGPKLVSCLTLENELSEETHLLTEQEILLGKGTRVESSRVREPRRTWLAVLGFMVMGLVSWWYLANHSNQSLSWWHTHGSAKMDASETDSGKWTDTRCLLSTFPELFRLVVAY